MAEHLTLERISALLDEPWADLTAEAHLERCDECRAEYERLSRMRMAVSALGELDPPPDAWARIEARLGDPPRRGGAPPLRRRVARRFLGSWPLQAAAAAVLFAAGLTAGVQFAAPGTPAVRGTVAGAAGGEPGADVPVVVPSTGSDAALLNALAELEALRSPVEQASLERRDGTLDPIVATQWIARLDGAIQAMQESVDRSPGDPVANAYLFQLLDERSRLTGELRQSVHLTQAVEW